QYDYQYDAVGNRTQMDISTSTTTDTYSYTYDDAYRMIEETQALMGNASVSTTYQYDRAGNRTRMADSSGDITQYLYNSNNELTRVNKPDYYFEDYTYDARGNLIQVEAGGHGTYSATNYAYNAQDQMVSYGMGSTPFITYEYDHADNRVAQTISSTTTNYLWDEFSRFGDVILETNPTNTIGYTLASGMLVSQTNNGAVDYFLQDAQGSTIGIADSSGAVTSNYVYDAFGNLADGTDPLALETNYLYTGQQFDPVYTELYNLRARQYDPSNGRFTSRDKWAYDYQNPFELNRYVYTSNNPMTYTDPSGNTMSHDQILLD
ncbi:MAG: RHS repeat-associated core domain-containing protein, partial [Phototrophicaceae bacterium]